MMRNLKLVVQVIGAYDLVSKERSKACCAFVELHFDGQIFRSSTKENDRNPVWYESFCFDVSDVQAVSKLPLDAYVYNRAKSANSKSLVGKVRITGTSFVAHSDAASLHYPLEKTGILSRARGELCLKIFLTDNTSITPSNPLPPVNSTQSQVQNSVPTTETFPREKKKKKKKATSTFHDIPPQSEPMKPKPTPAPAPPQYPPNFIAQRMKYYPPQAAKSFENVKANFAPATQQSSLEETSPILGGGQVIGGRVVRREGPVITHDLVEPMKFLFVRVVKARNLPTMDLTGSLDPYTELKIGNFKGRTKQFEKNQKPLWNEVFAFSENSLQSEVLEIAVKDKDLIKDDFVGRVRFDLTEVPVRVPPNSPLAPEWYRLEDRDGNKNNAEIMLAIWFGTQADEAFPEACYSDTLFQDRSSFVSSSVRSKVYHSPRLWYVRVNVIEAQDLLAAGRDRLPNAIVKLQLGTQRRQTVQVQPPNRNPKWNQEFMLVASEPFEDHLIVSVEDSVQANRYEPIGKTVVPLTSVERRADDRDIRNHWLDLENSFSAAMANNGNGKERSNRHRFRSRLNLSVCLDGGYHVFEEPIYYCSDLRPSAKQLRKSPIGALELGILEIKSLNPKKTRNGRGTSDTYCVAKYGEKWVRTRTAVDTLSPKFNEQYTWEVYDAATVLTVGVFENNQISGSKDIDGGKDENLGKVRIRLSTLEAGRIYTHFYPLLLLAPSGLKKMGELHLAIRFSCTSIANLLLQYSKPLLPKMHYKKPIPSLEQKKLRDAAVKVVSARLNRAEPPLRKEVVEYILEAHSHQWSIRKCTANLRRIRSLFDGILLAIQWMREVAAWKKPAITILIHIVFVILVFQPETILPNFFLTVFVLGLWNYLFRQRVPPHTDIQLSFDASISHDDILEEFDNYPTKQVADIVRLRYDRLRIHGLKVQTMAWDIAAQGERIQALISWRDPRATALFMTFCLVAAMVFYAVPLQVLVLFTGFYIMRHPKLRNKTPHAHINFFRRLPAKTESML